MPTPGATFQWQLSGGVDRSVSADVYDIDPFDGSAPADVEKAVADLHANGRKVICYVDVGSWEDFRNDKGNFPVQVIGKAYAGWKGEKWLDIRQIDLLAPVIRARFDRCKAAGFDAIEPDNIDSYGEDTGFPLTAADQLTYNRWLANEAHTRGLSIGLKNDGDQAAALEPSFDWALAEDCIAEDWCDQLTPFVRAGKAVWDTEYTDTATGQSLNFCTQSRALGIVAILKHRELDAWRQTCP